MSRRVETDESVSVTIARTVPTFIRIVCCAAECAPSLQSDACQGLCENHAQYAHSLGSALLTSTAQPGPAALPFRTKPMQLA